MDAPAVTLASVEVRLKRYMTVAGYALAMQVFGTDSIQDAVTDNGNDLRLAAAELLEGLPTESAGGGDLKRFKLDALEFEYSTSKTVSADWGAIAKRLREQATDAGASMTFEPIIDEWGVQ